VEASLLTLVERFGLTEVTLGRQESRAGNYSSWRLHVRVESAEQIVEVTEALQQVAGVRMVV
jgi:putative lipoic acid-binding regulatory protein